MKSIPSFLGWARGRVLLWVLAGALWGCHELPGRAQPSPKDPPPSRLAVDYSSTPDLSRLARADLAVVRDVLPSEAIRNLERGGTRVIARLPLGEVEAGDPDLPDLRTAGCILGPNPGRGSFYVDPGCPHWQELVLRRARALRLKGYAGLLLDRLDVTERFPQTAGGLGALVGRVAREVGGYLVQNGGLALLDSTAPYLQGVLYEGLSTGYNPSRGLYLYQEGDPSRALAYKGRLALLALDYAPADRPALAWRACERARGLGFVGYVAHDLSLGTGGVFCDALSPPPPYRATPEGVFRGGEPLPLYGLNWFGLETEDRAPHGLWAGRTVPEFLEQIRGLGFTALRLPLSPQVLVPGQPTPSWAQERGYPADAHEGLLYFLREAERAGLYVLLDFHTYHPSRIAGGLPGRPYGEGYSKEDWLRDLRRMAGLALSFPNVIGVDLCNEPHAMTWGEWREVALEGARALAEVNPFILVGVEGVGNASDNGGFPAFWGGNLTEAYAQPLVAPGSMGELPFERVLYLPHAYGPAVHNMPYFDAVDFPANLPPIWDLHFGRMAGRFPLGIGEFGGFYRGKDQVWQDAFVDYLLAKGIRVFFYWALNPNSGDTGGLLLEDWRTVHPGKLALLRRLMTQ